MPHAAISAVASRRRARTRCAVRAGEEAAQSRRQVELEDREGFLQPFAETGRDVGMTVGLEPALGADRDVLRRAAPDPRLPLNRCFIGLRDTEGQKWSEHGPTSAFRQPT
jgi:hypothetical protein